MCVESEWVRQPQPRDHWGLRLVAPALRICAHQWSESSKGDTEWGKWKTQAWFKNPCSGEGPGLFAVKAEAPWNHNPAIAQAYYNFTVKQIFLWWWSFNWQGLILRGQVSNKVIRYHTSSKRKVSFVRPFPPRLSADKGRCLNQEQSWSILSGSSLTDIK